MHVWCDVIGLCFITARNELPFQRVAGRYENQNSTIVHLALFVLHFLSVSYILRQSDRITIGWKNMNGSSLAHWGTGSEKVFE